MKKTFLPLMLLVSFCIPVFFAAANPTKAQEYKKVPGGILVRFKTSGDDAKALRLTVISEKIIRVTATPTGEFSTTPSLMVLDQQPFTDYKVTENKDQVQLETKSIRASVSLENGKVSFTDKNGKPITAEQDNSRRFKLAPVDGQNQYTLYQSFKSPGDEALYGLGQHQEGMMNYKGKDVLLLQQNSDVAVPFMISNKNYGLLWDNYSITRFGDTREYQQLSKLILYDKNGNPGGLTATYKYPESVFTTRSENEIDYPYLNAQSKFPQGFKMANGTVSWEGSIESAFTGEHKFHLYYAGYTKIWLDGKLVMDSWRQSWNPASHKWQASLVKGKKTPSKLNGILMVVNLTWH
jgi:alpha-D-xyloside xylohydrolase